MARKQIEQRVWIDSNLRKQIFHESNHTCARCGKTLTYQEMTTEHIIPLSKGGTNNETNLICLCEDCNKQKSNDIVNPIEYYPYLPESRKPDIEQMFEEYIQTVNWLDRDCLLMLDHFTMRTNSAIYMQKQNTLYKIPTTVQVDKMSNEDTQAFFKKYKEQRLPYEQDQFQPDEKIILPHYRIHTKGHTLLVFSVEIDKLPENMEPCDILKTVTGSKNYISICVYSDPDEKPTNHTKIAMNTSEVIQSLINTIQKTLKQQAPNSVIDLLIRSLKSDKIIYDAIRNIATEMRANVITGQDPRLETHPDEGGQIVAKMVLCQMHLDKQVINKNSDPLRLQTYVRNMHANEPIDKQIENSPTTDQRTQQKIQYQKRHKNKKK